MEHDLIIITPDNEVGTDSPFRDLHKMERKFFSQPLRSTRFFMNQNDYEDLLDWIKDNK